MSFFLTASLSLPLYWFKRIYKPTLFPANVEVEAHELWGGMVELEDESSNSKTLGYEKTAEEEMGFSSFDVPEDLKVRVQKNIRKGSSKKLKHRKKAKRGTKKGGKKK